MAAEFMVFLSVHVVFLAVAGCLHGVASWLAVSVRWRTYHLCVVLLSIVSIILAVWLLAGTGDLALHRGIAYGIQFVTYGVAWIWPAILSIQGRQIVEEMKSAVQSIRDTLR